jgi:hypothetical protein
MGQKLSVGDIEGILENEFHPATSKGSNALKDGLKLSTVTCTVKFVIDYHSTRTAASGLFHSFNI